MDAYKHIYINRYKRIIDDWKQESNISGQMIEQLLKNIKETAYHIELDELTEMASYLLNKLEQSQQTNWKEEEWSNFLQPLVILCNDEMEKQSERKRVLLIDNDVSSLHQVKEALEKQSYEVLMATNQSRAVKLFYDFHPDILILDGCNDKQMVFNIISRLNDRAKEDGVILFIIGDKDDVSLKIDAYNYDITDYIDKPIDNALLEQIMQNRLRQQAFFRKRILIDELTQAYNRTFLQTIWKELLKKYIDRKLTFSIAILDLDFFKQINDQCGHGVGDEVLKYFSSFILYHKRQQDHFIRYGGEEFILILPELGQASAGNLVQSLLDKLLQTPFQTPEQEIEISFTAGITEMKQGIKEVEVLIQEGDKALYLGKENGRKRIELFQSDLNTFLTTDKKEKLKLAIVDDDRFIQRLLEDKMGEVEMSPYQMEVESYYDGESFMESDWYRGRDKKILLLDGVLPKLDGLDILKELRKKVNEKELGIIMLTGRQKNSDMVKALELGADDYITKPFSLDQLEARIKRLVQRLFIK